MSLTSVDIHIRFFASYKPKNSTLTRAKMTKPKKVKKPNS